MSLKYVVQILDLPVHKIKQLLHLSTSSHSVNKRKQHLSNESVVVLKKLKEITLCIKPATHVGRQSRQYITINKGFI